MTEAKHTALPWVHSYLSGIIEDQNGGRVVARCPSGHTNTVSLEQAFANAALIVTAVNERPALLALVASLEADNARLREALRPFAEMCEGIPSRAKDHDRVCDWKQGGTPSVGEARRARAALQEQAR